MKQHIARLIYLGELADRIHRMKNIYSMCEGMFCNEYYKLQVEELVDEFNSKKYFFMLRKRGV